MAEIAISAETTAATVTTVGRSPSSSGSSSLRGPPRSSPRCAPPSPRASRRARPGARSSAAFASASRRAFARGQPSSAQATGRRAPRAAPAPQPPDRPRRGSRARRRSAALRQRPPRRRCSRRCRRSQTRRRPPMRSRAACSISSSPGRRPALLRRRLPDRTGADLVGSRVARSPPAPRRTAPGCGSRGRPAHPGQRRRARPRPARRPGRRGRRRRRTRSTRSGSSLRKKSAPCSRAARVNGSANAISSSAQRGAFSRSWITSTPPAMRRVEQLGRDRGPSGCASQTKYRRAVRSAPAPRGRAARRRMTLVKNHPRPSARPRSGPSRRRGRSTLIAARAALDRDLGPDRDVKSRPTGRIRSGAQRHLRSIGSVEVGGCRAHGVAAAVDAAPRPL